MRLRYTRPALTDLENVLSHIASESPQGALRVHGRLKAITALLAEHPLIGRRFSDPTIRRIAAQPYPYVIFYEATDTEIIIHAIRHGARDPSSMPGVE